VKSEPRLQNSESKPKKARSKCGADSMSARKKISLAQKSEMGREERKGVAEFLGIQR
jgi:hypothetical protein